MRRWVLLPTIFDVPNRKMKIEDKEALSLDPDFWDDPKRAESILKEIKLHKFWVEMYESTEQYVEDTAVLYEFYKEGESSEEEVESSYQEAIKQIEEMEFRATLNKKEDELNCILEINAGAGGTESCDWSAMLERMYLMWADKNGYKVNITNRQDGDVAGIKSVEMEISGNFAYGMLKGENGVHRLVRVSPFNAQGKRMTSFSSVFVHPVIDDSIDIKINPSDLKWDTFRASGAGGQHVNKTESAVRVTHEPTGLVAECQEERSQHMNRDKAIKKLKNLLYELELQKQYAERDKVEAGKMANEWGSQIRSYVLDDRWVKDLRSGYKVHNPDAVLNGDIDGFLKSVLMMNSLKIED